MKKYHVQGSSLHEGVFVLTHSDSIKIYDTTLRDGSQAEDIAFSVEDKIRIAQKLDGLGIHYIEGGWPGSNPKDKEFFRLVKNRRFRHAIITAFGSTRRAKLKASEDINLRALITSGAKTMQESSQNWRIPNWLLYVI
jgi:2-isopropylmalate synthase